MDVCVAAKIHLQFGRDYCIFADIAGGQFHGCCDIPERNAVLMQRQFLFFKNDYFCCT